ncbi:MAG: PQQ-dependent dehydrogenase, methanol/ethanol family [Deltaproteobacteria bacterium]|nr:PQQ-dependent dehydrogenase, methanol/ethanol family [Deltaproteobacteria bacterium]
MVLPEATGEELQPDEITLRDAGIERPGEWLTHGRSYAEQRFSPLARIDTGNVGELGLAWIYETGTTRGLEATPLVHEGVMYATASWSVAFALDARTGRELWRYDPGVPRRVALAVCCDVVNRGLALYRGRVYLGTLDGRLIALDARSGELVWEVQTTDPARPYSITGAPRVVRGKVIIGNSGAERGVRGYVSAYDAQSGELVWRFYTVPGDPAEPFESAAIERAAATWKGGRWWEIGGGGTVWDSLAYDPELDLLYVGTGNGSPWIRSLRSPGGGDNLYLSSILALRPDTGELVWHYQTTPGDSWDYTATQHMILAEIELGGRSRRVLMQAPKNGFFYVLDRETGELLSAEPYVTVTWAEGVDLATGRPVVAEEAWYGEEPVSLRPSPNGGHNWHPMSFHRDTGLVLIPAMEMGFNFAVDADFRYRPGAPNIGIDAAAGSSSIAGGAHAGFLLAWDPVAQREVWRVPHRRPWNGGVLSTAGGLVFQGTGHATLEAFRVEDGTRLFQAPTGTGVVAPPISYEVGGEQYVSVLAGWGGGFALASADPPAETLASRNRGRLLTFKLGGKLELDLPPVRPPAPLEAIPIVEDEALVAAGGATFTRWCVTCHGAAAIGGGTVPDLRRLAPPRYAELEEIVVGGALVEAGMPSFGDWLDAQDVEAIRAYLLARRAALREEERVGGATQSIEARGEGS